MIEREIKLEIPDAVGFDRLVTHLEAIQGRPGGSVEQVNQVNHYLDSRDLRLADALALLRIRTSSTGSAVLTYKSGTLVETGYFRSKEIEQRLERGVVPSLLERPDAILEQDWPPVHALVADFGPLSLEVLGQLENRRTRIQVEGRLLELDAMRFPDGSIQFELEIEFRSGEAATTRAWARALLDSVGVEARPAVRTKLHRLLRVTGRSP